MAFAGFGRRSIPALAFAVAGLGLAACAAPGSAAKTDPAAQARSASAALVFTPEPGKDFGDETAFSRSVAARYPAPRPLEALLADLTSQGMSCSGLTAVPTGPDMALMDCVRTDSAGGACFDAFALTVTKAPGEGMASATRARYARRCLGALPAQ
jgi:hypothetical protein